MISAIADSAQILSSSPSLPIDHVTTTAIAFPREQLLAAYGVAWQINIGRFV